MRFFEATTAIDAPADAVWAVLTDGQQWASWDSGVDEVQGRIAPGNTITIRSAAAPGRSFPVTVTAFEAPRRMTFTGGMPLGLFRGVRSYELTPEPDGRTGFRMREEYTGPLVALIWRTMPDLTPSFERFAQGLKRRVETGG